MDATMTGAEVNLAKKIIGLSGSSIRASKNKLSKIASKDETALGGLISKGHARRISERSGERFEMTGQGIQQLKLQIGEFAFHSVI